MSMRASALMFAAWCFPALLWGQVRVGPGLQVNAYTTGSQTHPEVAVHPNGDFVVTWSSLGQDGSEYGVFGRLHDAVGTPLGAGEFRINAVTQGRQVLPRVAPLPGGSFVVVWMSEQGGTSDIFGRRFDAAGAPGPEFVVNTYVPGTQLGPVVASNASGASVVVWLSLPTPTGGFAGLFGQRYDSAGLPLGGEFEVSAYPGSMKRDFDVAMGENGSFVVVWSVGVGNYEIHARRYDPSGAPVAGEFKVNLQTSAYNIESSIGMAPDGRFVVAWVGVPAGASDREILARRFDASGAALSGEFQLNVGTAGTPSSPDVAMDARGNFVVVWHRSSPGVGVFGRRFDNAGSPDTPDFSLGASVNPSLASVSMDDAGNFVTVWADLGAQERDVFAQPFRPDVIFKDGFDTSGLAAWSTNATDGGDLTVSLLAAMKGTTAGLRGVVDDTASLFVQDDSPDGERRYHARFYLDPNGFDPGEAQQHFRTRVFIAFSEAPTRRVAAIVLRRRDGAFSIRARARLDDNTQHDTPFIAVDDGPHAIGLEVRASSAPDANDGRLLLYIDGVFVNGAFDLDNSLAEVDFARLGALSVKTGANGTLFWDEFESRRQSPIGP